MTSAEVRHRKRDLHRLRGDEGLALETERSQIGAYPLSQLGDLFVCQHNPLPAEVSLSHWRLEVYSGDFSRDVGGAQLLALPRHTVTAVLQCAGNGRRFAEHEMLAPRTPNWSVGAVGNVEWRGVRLIDLVKHLGLAPHEPFLTTTGGELKGSSEDILDEVVERSIPTRKALDDGLLAWEMNDLPLPLEHGGPLRLVVPGYFGINHVKWVSRLAFTEHESTAKLHRSSYRLRPIGAEGRPQHPTTWQMPVKSFVTQAERRGPVVFVRGVAFSGAGWISRVELTTDDGATWTSAKLESQAGRYAWRRFTGRLEGTGARRVASRAVDCRGEVQPKHRLENERGYANASWLDHALQLDT